ncbi:unnamed protein product [Parajaminaea phylloscopi]
MHRAKILSTIATLKQDGLSDPETIEHLMNLAIAADEREEETEEEHTTRHHLNLAIQLSHPINAAVFQASHGESRPIVTSTRKANPMCSMNGKTMRLSELRQRPDWPQWQQAMHVKWSALESQQTFQPVSHLPEGKNLVGHKWVFVEKTDKEGNVIKFKARLVAQGFSQVKGVDFTDTFSPVVKLDTLRILFAMAVQEKLKWRLFDVASAYLYGENKHEIYMVCPDDFKSSGSSSRILRVLRSLYGLKESGRIWFSTLSDCLEKEGFRMCPFDPCVYVDSSGTILVIYVDDLAVFARSEEQLDHIEAILQRHFKVTVSPSSNSFIGLSIETTGDSVVLHQKAFCRSMLTRFGYEQINATKTPAEHSKVFDPPPDDYHPSTETIHDYLSKIGSLLWLSGLTRPDIHQSVTRMARHAHCPTEQHFEALKKIFRYIKGTMDLGLCFDPDPQLCRPYPLLAFSDANFAEASDSRKSTTGMVMMLGRNCILWMSKLQSIIAHSTTDAEYVALSATCRELKSVSNFLVDVFGSTVIKSPHKILCDNNNAVLASDTVPKTTKTRHLDLHFHIIRDHVKEKRVVVERVDTKYNLADILTKPQRPQAISDFQTAINLIKVP